MIYLENEFPVLLDVNRFALLSASVSVCMCCVKCAFITLVPEKVCVQCSSVYLCYIFFVPMDPSQKLLKIVFGNGLSLFCIGIMLSQLKKLIVLHESLSFFYQELVGLAVGERERVVDHKHNQIFFFT